VRTIVEVEVTSRLTVSQADVRVSSTLVGLATRYYFLSEGRFLKVTVLSMWGALSDERYGLLFVILSLKYSDRTWEETREFFATEPSRLMLFGRTVAVSCENRTEHMNARCGHRLQEDTLGHPDWNSYRKKDRSLTTAACLFPSVFFIYST
jgi:hypothetical protein